MSSVIQMIVQCMVHQPQVLVHNELLEGELVSVQHPLHQEKVNIVHVEWVDTDLNLAPNLALWTGRAHTLVLQLIDDDEGAI